jgi:hypothetical protein
MQLNDIPEFETQLEDPLACYALGDPINRRRGAGDTVMALLHYMSIHKSFPGIS